MAKSVRLFFAERAPDVRRIVVAVSGGADSTALLIALAQARVVELTAAHVNHHLRGDDSDRDQEFIEAVAARFAVPLEVRHVTLDPALIRRDGVEAAARRARYDALREVAQSVGADAIATAHHRDDQAETLLMRLISGAGPLRLGGIRERAGNIIRPLLTVTREELEQFVAQHGIVARDDAMNVDSRFLRTRIRRELLPLARIINPRVDAALEETARQTVELEHDLDVATQRLFGASLQRTDDATSFDVTPFLETPFFLHRLIHREIGRLDETARDVSASDLRRIAAGTSSRESVTEHVEVLRNGSNWTIQLRACAAPEPYAMPIAPGEEITLPGAQQRRFALHASRDTVTPSRRSSSQLFEVNGEDVSFEVRTRRPGDRFHPLGAPSEKSLKDFLVDRKIARRERDNIPLLTCNGEIVWVAGVEISEKYKVRGIAEKRFLAELIDDQTGLH